MSAAEMPVPVPVEELIAMLERARKYLAHPDIQEAGKNFAVPVSAAERKIAGLLERAKNTSYLAVPSGKSFHVLIDKGDSDAPTGPRHHEN